MNALLLLLILITLITVFGSWAAIGIGILWGIVAISGIVFVCWVISLMGD